MSLFRLAPLLLLALAAGACGAPPPPPAATDPAFETLRAADTDAFRAAFAPDTARGLVRFTRTAELAADGTSRAVLERTVRLGPDAPVVIAADTTGTFSDHLLDRWAPNRPGFRRNTADDLLPADAAFLTLRGRDDFRYTQRPDTLLLGRPTHVVHVDAVPGEGDDQAVRHARLYVDAATGMLVALHTERASDTLLFDEAATAFLQLRRHDDGTWRPHRTVFDQRVKALFQPFRRFRTESRFEA